MAISFIPMCANDGYSLPIEAAIFWEFSDEFCAVEVSPKYKESSACYVPLGPEFREKHGNETNRRFFFGKEGYNFHIKKGHNCHQSLICNESMNESNLL